MHAHDLEGHRLALLHHAGPGRLLVGRHLPAPGGGRRGLDVPGARGERGLGVRLLLLLGPPFISSTAAMQITRPHRRSRIPGSTARIIRTAPK